MNLHKFLVTGFLVGGLLVGCDYEQTTKDDEYVETEEDYSIEWEDVSVGAKEFVADALVEVNKVPSGNYEEGYEQYLLAEKISGGLRGYIRGEGDNLEKDFTNLFMITSIISHEQFVRTAHIDGNGGAKDRVDSIDKWKPVQEAQLKAFDYMKQLLNDLDVALNKDGEGSRFGVTYYLDGENAVKMEMDLSIQKEE